MKEAVSDFKESLMSNIKATSFPNNLIVFSVANNEHFYKKNSTQLSMAMLQLMPSAGLSLMYGQKKKRLTFFNSSSNSEPDI